MVQREPLTGDPPLAELAELTPEAALSEIYARHVRFVWRNLRRLGVPDVSLEDAVQDVFLVVHRRLPEFRAQSRLQTWLFAIVLRVAHDYRRSIRRRRARFVEAEPAILDSGARTEPDEHAELTARPQPDALLHRLLDSMDRDKRAVLVLVELEQMTLREAAEALGVNFNVACSRLRAARAAFNTAVAELAEEDICENHPSPALSAELALDQRRARELLDSVLAEMPVDLRTVLVLCELEEMTMAAIGALLSLPTGTVASRLRRARAMFQDKADRLRRVMASDKTAGGASPRLSMA